MKNYRFLNLIFIAILISAGVLSCRHQVKAAGTIQLIDFSTSITAVVDTPFSRTVRFIYSGNDLVNVSFLEKNIPDNLKVGTSLCGGNGQCSFILQGRPETVGDYHLTILLTDNNGAILAQPFELRIINRQLSLSTYSLPDGAVGKPYSAAIKVTYIGQITINLRQNIQLGSGMEINTVDQPSTTEYPSGQYLITIKGTPKNPAVCNIDIIVASAGVLPQGIFPYHFIINSGPKVIVDISQLKVKAYSDNTKKKLLDVSKSSYYNQPQFIFSGQKNGNAYYIHFGTNGQTDPVKNGTQLTGNEFRPKKIIKAGVYYLIIKAKNSAGDLSKPVIIKYKYRVA